MSLFDVSNVYTPTTYEEMTEAKKEAEMSAKKYKQAYKNFLITCLCEAGFVNKRVLHNRTGCVGVLRVEEKSYNSPYEIKFYPIRKDGEVSLKPKYHGYHREENLIQCLTENFKIVGDENAG